MRLSSAGRSSVGSSALRPVNGNSNAQWGTGRSRLPTASSRSSYGSRSSSGSRSSIGGRLSTIKKPAAGTGQKGTGTSSRRSSAYGRGHPHEVPKDPRPINTKSFKEQSIAELIDFLNMSGYPQQLSPKMLQSPITKDFLNIFQFLVRIIARDVKLSGKHEEEVPVTFKSMKYPFQISKSAMFAVGSPHIWPAVLGALTWLCKIIDCVFMSDVDATTRLFQGDNFGDNEQKYIFLYNEKAYKEFMAGAESFEELNEELAAKIRSCGEMSDMDQIMLEHQTLTEQLNHLQEQPDQILAKKTLLLTSTSDNDKFKDYDASLDTHLKTKGDKEQQLDTETAELRAELEAITQENKKKLEILKTQEFSLTDVQRIKMDKQELQQSIEVLENETKNIDQQIWSVETHIAKIQERNEKKCMEYNQVATELRLIPSTAENACGQDYELSNKASKYRQHAEKFINIIKPGLNQLKTHVKQLVHQTVAERIAVAESLDQLNDFVNDKKHALSLLNSQYKRLEDSGEDRRKEHLHEQEQLQTDIDLLQDELLMLRKQAPGIQDAQRHLSGEQQKAKLREDGRQQIEREYMSFLEQVADVVLTHKGFIQEHTSAITEQLEKAYQADRERLQKLGFRVDPQNH